MLMILNMSIPSSQLESFEILRKEQKIDSFSDILDEVEGVAPNQRPMINEIAQICKLLYLNPATAARTIYPYKNRRSATL